MRRISNLKVQNFKSFNKLEVNFNDFDVVIGQNASGKSNFIQIFRFLRDIENHGLDNAISIQGGLEFLRNVNIGASENVTIEVTAEIGSTGSLRPFPFGTSVLRHRYFRLRKFTYRFSL